MGCGRGEWDVVEGSGMGWRRGGEWAVAGESELWRGRVGCGGGEWDVAGESGMWQGRVGCGGGEWDGVEESGM